MNAIVPLCDDYRHALRRLPVLPAGEFLAERPLVVIAPHPDDESLGLGGLLACAAERDPTSATVIFVTDGEGSHRGSPTVDAAQLAQLRRTEAKAALRALGLPDSAAHFLQLPDSGLEALSREHAELAIQAIADRLPERALVCVTAATDPHADHRVANQWARAAAQRRRAALWQFPVWTWAEHADPLPTMHPIGWRLDISPYLAAKRAAIATHRSQHGGVIHDASEAFELPSAFLRHFQQTFEVITT